MKLLLKKAIIKCLGLDLPISLMGNSYIFPGSALCLKQEFIDSEKVYCNINFDDQCPSYGQIDGQDYGGNINEGIAKNLYHFLEKYPHAAITSFVIPNFLGNTKRFKNRFLLSHPDYSAWISYYTELSGKFNIEYALHGYFHQQSENPFFQKYTEFAFKNDDETMFYITKAIEVFHEIGWQANGFRQPAWDLSSSIDLPQIAQKCGLKYIASNSLDGGYNNGAERVSNYFPTLINGTLNFPQNIELDWSLDRIINQIEVLIEMHALISIKAHFVDKGMVNCLSDSNFEKLDSVMDYLSRKHSSKIQYVTFSQLAGILQYE